MADITERLREHAAIHDAQVPFDNEQREWADDLRFAAAEIARLRARVAEFEAARGEPVAYLHQVVCGDDEPDQALSFAPDNFPLSGVLGYRSLSHVPLYTAPLAPTVDVNAISDEALNAAWSYIIFNAENEQTEAVYDMRAALRAIFNKGE